MLYDLSSQNSKGGLTNRTGSGCRIFIIAKNDTQQIFSCPSKPQNAFAPLTTKRDHLSPFLLLTSFPKEKQTKPFSCGRSSSENNMKIENSNFYIITSQSNTLAG